MADPKSVREMVKARDGLSDEELDDMFAEFEDGLEFGEDPEELVQEIFGLEPDYIFDRELMGGM